jgi:hypothetical protein
VKYDNLTYLFYILKFFILSRFTKSFVILTIVFSGLMVLFYLSIGKIIFVTYLSPQLKISALEFVTFFLVFNLFSSIVQKADFDFLLTSPVKTTTLALLYVVGSMFTGGAYFIVLSTYMISLYPPPYSYIAFTSFSIFGIAVSSLTLSKNKFYIIFALVFLSWLPYFHFYFTPTALIFGHLLSGILSSLILSALVLYYSVRYADLQLSGSKVRAKRSSLINGKQSVLRIILNNYEFVWGYGSTFSGRRIFFYVIPYYKAIGISALISLVYLCIEITLRPPFYTGIIAPNVLIVSFLSTTGLYALSQERPWLTFMSLDQGRIIAEKIIIKTLQTAFLSLPFVIVDSILGRWSVGISLFSGVMAGYLVTAILMSKLNPIQFRGEVYNYKAGSGMIVVIMVDYIIIAMTITAGLFLLTSVLFLLTSVSVLIVASIRKNMWEKISFNLVEKGFQ